MPPSEHLEDITNEPRAFRLPSATVDRKQSTSLRGNSSHQIRRVYCLDSSETSPSEHPSIYDAEPVLSEREESLETTNSDDEQDSRVPSSHLPQSSRLENIAPPSTLHPSSAEAALRALNAHFSSHGRWPNTRLDTIVERLSQKTPRTSASFSRAISASVEYVYGRPAPDAAATSSGFDNSTSQARAQRPFGIYHRRCFSLNDLDCLKPKKAQHFNLHDSSSSSGDALPAAGLYEAYPVQPQEPPPVRVPTPPGLPTFGTREAMEYRMPGPGRTIPNSPDTTAGITRTPPSTLADGLKRLLGMIRVVSPIPEEPTRAVLPSYLARADDSTFVRGRFGARHSAHGIGRGQLDNHPFHRDPRDTSGTRRTSLERAVQEIEKACAETERQRLASASPRAHGESAPRSGSGSPRLPAQHTLTIAEVLSQGGPSGTLVEPSPAPRPVEQAMRSLPSLTFDRLGSGGSIQSQSTAGIDGMRHFVEQGERVSAEQNRELSKKKKQRSGCANCWFAFCVYCCDGDDPDCDVVDASRVMAPERGVSALQSPEIRPLRIVHEQPRTQRMVYH